MIPKRKTENGKRAARRGSPAFMAGLTEHRDRAAPLLPSTWSWWTGPPTRRDAGTTRRVAESGEPGENVRAEP